MTALVEQRNANDCMIAAIAMALGRPYEHVLTVALSSEGYIEGKGCKNEHAILRALGLSDEFENGKPAGDFVVRRRGYEIAAEFFRDAAWGRRAIFTVPSLVSKGGWHAVYYDGRDVFDPNPPEKPRYTSFGELRPDEAVLFRENPEPEGE